jgi:hypothetical protein
MPGLPFVQVAPSYQGVAGEGVPAAAAGVDHDHTMFVVWLVVIGVVIPAIVLGGLRAGGFQFVFKRR